MTLMASVEWYRVPMHLRDQHFPLRNPLEYSRGSCRKQKEDLRLFEQRIMRRTLIPNNFLPMPHTVY